MAEKPRIPVKAGSQVVPSADKPIGESKAEFFQGGRNMLLNSWRPQLRESQADVQASWQEAAARTVDAIQNSGFLTKIVETETGSVVGSGLRFASRPDFNTLGWSAEESSKFAREFEAGFRAYGDDPKEIDAAGKMNFDKMQQAAFGSYKCYGEVLALTPIIDRPGSINKSKVAMLPPHRLVQETSSLDNLIQGVKVDGWGYPSAYKIKTWMGQILGWQDMMFQARDRDGRPNVIHVFDSSIATVRGISPMAPILKVVRQVDQYADATLTAALLQTIFAATIKTSMNGLAAFDGMMTKEDGTTSLEGYLGATTQWYEEANVNLTQHGRIAHLFPGEELDFTEAKSPGQQYDQFMGWLMREIAAGAGVTYESATGDYRGATYSSIRMAGAQEWLTVLRRRKNVIIPFCNVVKELYAEEAILSGRLKLPKGGSIFTYYANKAAILRGSWSGPAQPQADDFKAARSHEVLKTIGGTTLKDIAESYGRDWEDDANQKAEENRFYQSLDLPLPWAPLTLLETKDGQDAELTAAKNDGQNPEKKPKKTGGTRSPGERDPANAKADELETELKVELGTEIEKDLIDGD